MGKLSSGFKALLDFLLSKVVVNATGLRGWIIKKALEYGGQLIYGYYLKFMKWLDRNKAQNEALKKNEEIQKDPNATVDDRGKSYEETINSGR